MYKIIRFSTGKEVELIDITHHVEGFVRECNVKEGLCIVHAPHATAAIIMNENESGLKEDIINTLMKLVPRRANYMHDRIDDNAHAHIKSAIIGSTVIIPIIGGRLARGTWQNIFFVELDGPRYERRVIIQVIPGG